MKTRLCGVAWVVFTLLLCLFALAGCGDRCPDCKDKDHNHPRPHLLSLKECDAGKVARVCCGDVVVIHLPCTSRACYSCRDGTPHVIHTCTDEGGYFRFRCAAPGHCMVRFHGPRELEYHFQVHP